MPTVHNKELTTKELRKILNYDPMTGIFTWKVNAGRWGRIKAGTKTIGSKCDKYGHLGIRINGKHYLVHRLAWLYMTGKWPSDQIDHKNRISSDNRWSNLREADNSKNNQNKVKAQSNNKIGLLGVSIHRYGFRARIFFNGNQKCLGVYKTPELAHKMYIEAKMKFHSGYIA